MQSKLFIRILSAIILPWYLFTVVGFDVHRSSECGRVFIEPLIAGISCERIHPDAPCRHVHEGLHSHEEHCDDDEECCHDDIFRISISGDVEGDLSVCPSPSFPVCVPKDLSSVAVYAALLNRPVPYSFTPPPVCGQTRFCVLRV